MADPSCRFSSWYCQDSVSPTSADSLAESTFNEAVRLFQNQLTNDPKTTKLLNDIHASKISDVLAVVNAAREHYEKRRPASQVKKCLVEVSRRIVYYSNVMDVMVQHHPEYVSLAWGTMKILFGAIVENEKLGMTIVTGLCEIADALPRTELFLELYPTDTMKDAATTLYTWVMRFLIRALKWYDQGKLRHVLHAVVKPAALQYDDIVSGIRQACQSMLNRASASSLAEQRDMHERVRAVQSGTAIAFPNIHAQQQETYTRLMAFQDHTMTALSNMTTRQDQISENLVSLTIMVERLRETIISDQAVRADAQIQLGNTMSEIQLTQALEAVSLSLSLNHMAILQQSVQIRDRRRVTRNEYAIALQGIAAFNDWNRASTSTSITIKSTFKNRHLLCGSLSLVIESLRRPQIAVLWALKCQTQAYDTIEVLKSLIYQALKLDYVSGRGVVFSFQLRQYLGASTEEDYINLLGEILQHFKLVYIVVQLESLPREASSRFQRHLDNLMATYKTHAPSNVLKILLAGSGPSVSSQQAQTQNVFRMGSKKERKRLGKRHVSLSSSKLRQSADSHQAD